MLSLGIILVLRGGWNFFLHFGLRFARPQCKKNFQPPLRTKMIPWDNTAKPSGQKNACTLPRDTKILWFPWDYEKIKLLEAEKNLKKKWPRLKMCLELMKKSAKKSAPSLSHNITGRRLIRTSYLRHSYFYAGFCVLLISVFLKTAEFSYFGANF